ncbi:DUF7523 family protein [Halorussus amylolyticus]|uniref:DUF7523 family protein n=1 Tax=Halorussus amylolyticus TaxID=1126242 RepID=UPI001042B0AB|nr:hypothetical protein [Halorussus amylolyticus]
MSLAEDTRAAARRRPFLVTALRAGVVNYTAAARSLSEEVGGDTESVATALRRFAESLPEYETESRDVRVTMQSGLGVVAGSGDDAPLAVGGVSLVPDSGSLTAIVAEGSVGATALGHVLARLDAAEIGVVAAGVADESLVVAVERRDGPNALRTVEDALAAVPSRE